MPHWTRGTLTEHGEKPADARRQSVIRALRPTDILAVLAFSKPGESVDVFADDRTPDSGFSFREILERSLAIRPGRETWIAIEGGRVDGIVSAQARSGADLWDIDALRVVDGTDADRVCLALLDHLMRAAHEEGILKVFLRLRLDTPWSIVARQSGFTRYARESVFFAPAPRALPVVEIDGLRPRRPADHLALFHLYSSLVPLAVREVEAMTLQEWRWLDNWGVFAPARPRFPGNRRDFTVSSGTDVEAWVQIQHRQQTIRMLHDSARSDRTDSLVDFALAQFRGVRSIGFVARDYESDLRRVLTARQFMETESDDLFARILAVRVPDIRLVPARAL